MRKSRIASKITAVAVASLLSAGAMANAYTLFVPLGSGFAGSAGGTSSQDDLFLQTMSANCTDNRSTTTMQAYVDVGFEYQNCNFSAEAVPAFPSTDPGSTWNYNQIRFDFLRSNTDFSFFSGMSNLGLAETRIYLDDPNNTIASLAGIGGKKIDELVLNYTPALTDVSDLFTAEVNYLALNDVSAHISVFPNIGHSLFERMDLKGNNIAKLEMQTYDPAVGFYAWIEEGTTKSLTDIDSFIGGFPSGDLSNVSIHLLGLDLITSINVPFPGTSVQVFFIRDGSLSSVDFLSNITSTNIYTGIDISRTPITDITGLANIASGRVVVDDESFTVKMAATDPFCQNFGTNVDVWFYNGSSSSRQTDATYKAKVCNP